MSGAWQAWRRFWFEPVSPAPLMLIRTAFGVLIFLWAVSLLPDATTFFGPGGILPAAPHQTAAWSLFDVWGSNAAVVSAVVALGLAGLLLAAGIATRPAAAVAFVVLVSLGNRDPFVGNSGDALLRILALYVLIAQFYRGRALPLRLVQIQLSMIYLATVWAKLRGVTWPDGTAVSYAFRLEDLARFAVPDVGSSLALTHVLSYGTLVVEASLGVLVWVRRLRPWVLLAGVCLHLGIEYRLRVGFFSWAMVTTYLAFVSPVVAERVLARVPWIRSRRWLESASTP